MPPLYNPVTGGGGSSTPTARKHLQIVNSTRLNTTAPATPYLVAKSIWIPADVSIVRVHMANRDSFNGTQCQDAPTTLAVGTPVAGLNGWASAPTTQALTVTANGVLSQSFSVVRNAAGYIMLAWYAPTGATFAYEDQTDGFQNTNSTDVVNVPGLVASTGAPFEVSVEYTTLASRLVIFGDSLVRGLAASGGAPAGLNATFAALGASRGLAVTSMGVGGFKLVLANPTNVQHYYWDQSLVNLVGAKALVLAGVNDLFAGDTLANMKNYLYFVVRDLRAAGVSEVWVSTIAPINAVNTTRDGYNAFVRAYPFGLDYVLDSDLVLRDPGTPLNLLPAYDADQPSGHLHWKVAGYTALNNQLISDGKV